MGCGGSKDVVVSTNVAEDNNNSETKDVAITNHNSKCGTKTCSILLCPPPDIVYSFFLLI